MLAPKLEWTIVVEQPVEPPGERARRSRKNKNLMGPCPQSVSDKTGPAMGAHNYRGDQGKGAGALSAHGPDKRRASQRLHEVRGNQEIGGRPSQRVDGFGRAFVCVNPTRSDGREHRPHDQEHRPPVVDDRHGKRGEIAAKSAMVRNPPALSAFPCRPSYWEAGK